MAEAAGKPEEEETVEQLREKLNAEETAHEATRTELSQALEEERAAHNATREQLEHAQVRHPPLARSTRHALRLTLQSSRLAEWRLRVAPPQAASHQRRAGGDAAPGDNNAPLEELLQMSTEELAKALHDANAKISDLEVYTTELDGSYTSLQRQLEEAKAESGMSGEERLQEKERVIAALRQEVERMEREMGGMEMGGPDNDSAIDYDALDKLDDELAKAKEQCLLKDAEIAQLKAMEEAARRDSDGAAQWRESAVQARSSACLLSRPSCTANLVCADKRRHTARASEASKNLKPGPAPARRSTTHNPAAHVVHLFAVTRARCRGRWKR